MHAQGEPQKYHRIQFDFSEKMLAELHALQHRLKVGRGAVLMRALKVLVWAEAQHHHGNKIYVKRKNGESVEVQFPFLQSNPGSSATPSERDSA